MMSWIVLTLLLIFGVSHAHEFHCNDNAVQLRGKSALKSVLFDLRGGAVRGKSTSSRRPAARKGSTSENKKGKLNIIKAPPAWIRVRDAFVSVKPVTRTFISMTLATAAVHMMGLPAPRIFSLNMRKIYEIWRFFTAATYLGGPSLSLANNVYFLINYGQLLENVQGAPDFAFFILSQIGMLSLFSMFLQFPFTAHSVIAAIIYCCSRINAMDSM